MMPYLICFVAGVFLGTFLAVLILSLCAMAARGERDYYAHE